MKRTSWICKFTVASLGLALSVSAHSAQPEAAGSATSMEAPTCINWAQTRPKSEDRRMIAIFSNQRLSGQVYETFSKNDPPINSAETNTEAMYRSSSYVFDLFDVPKDEFESTAEYLDRRQSLWASIIGQDSKALTVGHQRLEFTYNADAGTMLIKAKYGELKTSLASSNPAAIRFSNSFVNRGRSSVSNDYYLAASNRFFDRLDDSVARKRRPLIIAMDGAAARDVNSSGIMLLKFRSPIFRNPRLPAAFQDSVYVEEMRALGYYNSIYADLECAVLATAGGSYYDVLMIP